MHAMYDSVATVWSVSLIHALYIYVIDHDVYTESYILAKLIYEFDPQFRYRIIHSSETV